MAFSNTARLSSVVILSLICCSSFALVLDETATEVHITDEFLVRAPKLETSFELTQYPLSIGQDVPFKLTIANTDLHNNLSANAHVIFPENAFTKRLVLKLGKLLSPGTSTELKFSLPARRSASYRDIPDKVDFQLIDEEGVIIPTSGEFLYRSDMFSSRLIEWSPKQLQQHSSSWFPSWLRSDDIINVCFFGIVGSGKSTTQNTLMSSLITSTDVETMRPTGGGGEHVTLKVEGVDLTQSSRRMNIRMKFWDTFGLTMDNWPENNFRAFLQGKLHSYKVTDVLPTLATGTTSLADRIHVVLLFMSSVAFKNELLFNKMADNFRVAVSEGYNPLLMITFANDLTPSERADLLDRIESQFNIAKRQVFFVPYSGDTLQRNLTTDREALYILDSIRASAEAFLDSHPAEPSSMARFGATALALLVSLGVFAAAYFQMENRKNAASVAARASVTPDSASASTGDMDPDRDESFASQVVTICHVQNCFKIRVNWDTSFEDLVPNVAKTFNLEGVNFVFEDEDGVQFPNESSVMDAGEKIHVRILTSV